MIAALLVVIVLILLFGAGVVKGWIANALALAVGGIVILGALLWLGSFFGENGVMYVFFAAMGLLFVGSLWARSGAGEEGNDAAAKARAKRRRRRHKL